MSETVKVIVRCRPINDRERDSNVSRAVSIDPLLKQCILTQPHARVRSLSLKTFTFDGSFDQYTDTAEIYNDIVRPIVEGVLQGYNATVFAYGQTGCGKTYTMEGMKIPRSQRGIIPRAIEHIFEQTESSEAAQYLLKVSYLEIYNEDIRDLLVKGSRYRLDIKEHPHDGLYVKGLSSVSVDRVEEVEQLFQTGSRNRMVGSTLSNADSSRSHSIFTIDIDIQIHEPGSLKDHHRTGRLNLVDLAGSERQSKSHATGQRFKEATKINLSLSVLGKVISALVDDKTKYIPYRESKLTRLLQNSLGGNSRTLMIACISPGENNYEETLSTLRYAKRAKFIKNKPTINEDPKEVLIRKYVDEINLLKKMLSGQIPIPPEMRRELAAKANVSEDELSLASPSSLEDSGYSNEIHRIREEFDTELHKINQQLESERCEKEEVEIELNLIRDIYRNEREKAEQEIKRLEDRLRAYLTMVKDRYVGDGTPEESLQETETNSLYEPKSTFDTSKHQILIHSVDHFSCPKPLYSDNTLDDEPEQTKSYPDTPYMDYSQIRTEGDGRDKEKLHYDTPLLEHELRRRVIVGKQEAAKEVEQVPEAEEEIPGNMCCWWCTKISFFGEKLYY